MLGPGRSLVMEDFEPLDLNYDTSYWLEPELEEYGGMDAR